MTSLRLLGLALLLIGCSLEPNPSPYPMPGGADVVQPPRPDTTADGSDGASVADVTASDDALGPTADISGDATADDATADDATADDATDDDATDDVMPDDVVQDGDTAATEDSESAEDTGDAVSDVASPTPLDGG